MNKVFDALEEVIGAGRTRQNEPLELHTILKRNGFAEYYVEVERVDELVKMVQGARKLGIPVFILGGGARIKTSKIEIKGLVIKNNCRRFDKMSMRGEIHESKIGVKDVFIFAEGGVITNQLVRFTIDEGLEGLEYQLGLPGTIGGAICTNAKYIPKYLLVNKSLQSMSILHGNGDIQSYSGDLPHFVYTDEVWEDTKDVILSAVFRLNPSDKKILWQRGEEAISWREDQRLKIKF